MLRVGVVFKVMPLVKQYQLENGKPDETKVVDFATPDELAKVMDFTPPEQGKQLDEVSLRNNVSTTTSLHSHFVRACLLADSWLRFSSLCVRAVSLWSASKQPWHTA